MVDTRGNAYIVGWTSSLDFPTSNGAFQPIPGGSYDAFVTKLDAGAASLIYSTYLGGSGWDEGNGIAIDADGNAYVTGNTASVNFPTTPGAFQRIYGSGGFDAFVTKLVDVASGPLPPLPPLPPFPFGPGGR